MKHSVLDPYLFISDAVITFTYMDDMLMWLTSEDNILKLCGLLRAEGVELDKEDDAVDFLG